MLTRIALTPEPSASTTVLVRSSAALEAERAVPRRIWL